jgi:hypothetical protein
MDVNGKDVIRWGKTNPDVWCDCMTNEIGVENNKKPISLEKVVCPCLRILIYYIIKRMFGCHVMSPCLL